MCNRNWLVIGLIVSLAVNLALAGFVVGQMSRPGPVPAALDPSLSLFRVLREMPEPRRESFRSTVKEHFRTLRGDIRRIRAAQRGIEQALAREPFEAEALETALAAFRVALLNGQEDNHEVLVEVATQMTAEERQVLLSAMKRPRHDHRRPASDKRPGNGAPR